MYVIWDPILNAEDLEYYALTNLMFVDPCIIV